MSGSIISFARRRTSSATIGSGCGVSLRFNLLPTSLPLLYINRSQPAGGEFLDHAHKCIVAIAEYVHRRSQLCRPLSTAPRPRGCRVFRLSRHNSVVQASRISSQNAGSAPANAAHPGQVCIRRRSTSARFCDPLEICKRAIGSRWPVRIGLRRVAPIVLGIDMHMRIENQHARFSNILQCRPKESRATHQAQSGLNRQLKSAHSP